MEYKKLQSIRKIQKPTTVYNFSVPNYESYIANGFVVHNCQNFTVSQTANGNSKVFQPQELVDLAVAKKAVGLVFTYNEPTVHYEYLIDVGVASHSSKLYLAIKTNGFSEHTTVRNLSLFFSAWNVDIKGDDKEYAKVCGGSLDPVLYSIELLSSMDVHLEISYLVLPRLVRRWKHHRRIRDFLAGIDPWMPVHILNFYPFHNMPDESYLDTELIKIVDLFRVKMHRVYVSNSFKSKFMPCRNTYCLKCGGLLVERSRRVTIKSLSCCGRKVRGVFLPNSV